MREHEEAVQPQLLVSNLGYLAPSTACELGQLTYP